MGVTPVMWNREHLASSTDTQEWTSPEPGHGAQEESRVLLGRGFPVLPKASLSTALPTTVADDPLDVKTLEEKLERCAGHSS